MRYGKKTMPMLAALGAAAALIAGCSGDAATSPNVRGNDNPLNPPGVSGSSFRQVNLVSAVGAAGVGHQDPTLVNPWGIATGPDGEIWISSTGSRTSAAYSADGSKGREITIPSSPSGTAPAPIGIIYNPTVDFLIPKRSFSRIIVANGTGTIAAWDYELGSAATVVADRNPDGAGYTGLTIARRGDANYLYVANFRQGKIDIFDRDFIYRGSFSDPGMASGYSPFNIREIDGMLYVTYAMRGGDAADEVTGNGLGSVVVFNPNGQVARRFASGGSLNAPWGIAKAPASYGSLAGKILVGNFGDGKINVYDANGGFMGQMADASGTPVAIDGLWGLAFDNGGRLYFTAGSDGEQGGLFGYLAAM